MKFAALCFPLGSGLTAVENLSITREPAGIGQGGGTLGTMHYLDNCVRTFARMICHMALAVCYVRGCSSQQAGLRLSGCSSL